MDPNIRKTSILLGLALILHGSYVYYACGTAHLSINILEILTGSALFFGMMKSGELFSGS